MAVRYLELADYLIIAENVLGVAAEELASGPRIHLAVSALAAPAAEYEGTEFYAELATKAAVLCAHLAQNHPLPDGNKRCAYLAMLEFLQRNGVDWYGTGDVDDTVRMVEGIASGAVPRDDFVRWVAKHLAALRATDAQP